ncbi:4'-phosphopantetheinyl transferase superfamily protein [Streptomyces sp. NPDC005962]|uniref:4'-phosphopantetheinyl transferase family protein n=1 Tax=Streptomyces sp. NPDC005962 TaxID=3154466 RepID=UPI0033CFC8F1
MPLIRPADDAAAARADDQPDAIADAPARTPDPWGPLAAPPRPEDRPGPGEVAVWLLHLPPSAAAATAVAERLLDAGERERAAGMRHERARERYITSHVGLRTLLGGYLGTDPADIEFTRETCGMPDCDKPHGRPALAGDATLAFSLSHAGDAALYAVSGGAPVGADIEERDPRRTGDRLDGLIGQLHPGERAAIAALPDEELRERAFMSCWVRKEAYLKGIGTGLPGGLRTHYVGLADQLAPQPPADAATPPGWTLTDLPAPPGYHAAVALHTDTAAAPAVTLTGLRLG